MNLRNFEILNTPTVKSRRNLSPLLNDESIILPPRPYDVTTNHSAEVSSVIVQACPSCKSTSHKRSSSKKCPMYKRQFDNQQ